MLKLANLGVVIYFDHVGGRPPPPFDAMGIDVPGVRSLVREDATKKIYVHPLDADQVCGGDAAVRAALVETPDAFRLRLGNAIDLDFLHTPGHTPGSQCLVADGTHLFSGDTLFIGSCGRVDLPDSSPAKLFESCAKLRNLAPSCAVLPGHNYGGPRSTIRQETQNGVLGMSAQQWRAMF